MKLKDKGRFGDTEIRVVNGEKAHVSKIEAEIIDRHGAKGEQFVQSVGSGTINPETGHREYFLWALAGISALAGGMKAVGKYNAGIEAGRRQGAYADKLSDLSGVTPSERKYVERQREIAEKGDPRVQEKMNRVIGNIRQHGSEQMQRTEGSIIRQGMESSIVAAELRRKTSDVTLKNIAEQSRRISAENQYAKEQAENRALQMEMNVGRREQQAKIQAAGIRANIPSGNFWSSDLPGDLMSTGLSAYKAGLGEEDI